MACARNGNAADCVGRLAHRVVTERMSPNVLGATVGNWGTRLAQAAVRQTLTAAGALVMPQPMLFVARANERFDPSGRLHDAEVSSGLRKVAQAFRQWMVTHR